MQDIRAGKFYMTKEQKEEWLKDQDDSAQEHLRAWDEYEAEMWGDEEAGAHLFIYEFLTERSVRGACQ
jgi:hypothetical protein